MTDLAAPPQSPDLGEKGLKGGALGLISSVVVGGKIVWFELPVDYSITPTGVSDGTFHFDLVEFAQAQQHETKDRGPVLPVNLLGIPVALLQKASEEYEALFRELRLMKEHAESRLSSSGPVSYTHLRIRARPTTPLALARRGARPRPAQLSRRGAPGGIRACGRGCGGAMGQEPRHLRGGQELSVHDHRSRRPGG